jgi:hypothetical protein
MAALRRSERSSLRRPAASLTILYRETVGTERVVGVEQALTEAVDAAFRAAHSSSGRSPWLKRFGSD